MAISRTTRIATLLTLGAMALAVSACDGRIVTRGSGVAETVTVDVDDADIHALSVSDNFDVSVKVVDGPASVEVTVDDNFVADLDTSIDNGRLSIGFDRGLRRPNVSPTAVISVARLDDLDLDGSSRVVLDHQLGGDVVHLDAGGASQAVVTGTFEELSLSLSGASSAVVTGSAPRTSLVSSGASNADLDHLSINEIEIDLSGASTARIGDTDRIAGELSGASRVTVPSGVVASLSTSGASTVDHN